MALPNIGTDPISKTIGKFALNALGSIYNPIANTINNAQAGQQQALKQNKGNPIKAGVQAVENLAQNTVANPKLLADLASLAVPFGKGANVITKAILPGAAAGGLSDIAQPNSTPSSVIGNSIIGGATGGILHGVSKMLPNIGEGLQGAAQNEVKQEFRGIDQKTLNKNKLGNTAKSMLQYGAKNPEEFGAISKKASPFLTDLTDNAVSQSTPIDTTGLFDFAKNLTHGEVLLPAATKKAINNQIAEAVTNMAVDGIEGGHPTVAMKTIRTFEGRANQPATTEVGLAAKRVYGQLADELKSRLFDGVNGAGEQIPGHGANNVVASGFLTPEVLQQAQDIHPLLGQQLQDIAATGGTVRELRGLNSQFVKASKLAGAAQDVAENSIPSAGLQGDLGAIATAFKPVTAPLLLAKKALVDSRGATSARIDTFNKVGGALQKGLPSIGQDAISQAGVRTATGLTNGLGQPGAENNKGNQPDNTHMPGTIAQSNNNVNGRAINYTDIPSDVTQLKPDPKTGQYTITSPQAIMGKNGTPLAMSEQDYTSQKAKLQHDLGTLEVKYNPQVSAQKQAELEQLETTHSMSAKLQENYDGAMKVSNAVASANNLLSQAPPSLLRDNPTIDKLSRAFDGKYATLAQQLQVLQKYYPVMTDSILKSASTENARAVLNQLTNQNAQYYYQTINGVTGNVPGVSTGAGLPQPTGQGLPAIPQSGGGGWSQAMPANPAMELAPIPQ